ncbi:MAG: sigma-70 family RNA polymerase sigma factor [Ideonella sp.]|nr:sigma-70 family RNA polymerase sigma factor [Ideonella sp.]
MSTLLSLWARHEPELRAWLRGKLSVAADVEDVLQDSFIKVLRHEAQLTAVAQPRAWLFEVTRNTLIDRLRAAAHPVQTVSADAWDLPDEATPLDPVDALAACIPRVLSELDAQDREAIECCDLQGMPQAEFARLKGLSLSGAKSRVQRARQRLHERMAHACQVSLSPEGQVEDFVPRPPLPDATPP